MSRINLSELMKELHVEGAYLEVVIPHTDISVHEGRISESLKTYVELSVYRAFIPTGSGAIVGIETDQWYDTEDGTKVTESEKDTLKKFGLTEK